MSSTAVARSPMRSGNDSTQGFVVLVWRERETHARLQVSIINCTFTYILSKVKILRTYSQILVIRVLIRAVVFRMFNNHTVESRIHICLNTAKYNK